jgi:replicative DNA helicase
LKILGDETADVFDLLDKAESKTYEVPGNIKRSSETAQSLVLQAKKELKRLRSRRFERMLQQVLISQIS